MKMRKTEPALVSLSGTSGQTKLLSCGISFSFYFYFLPFRVGFADITPIYLMNNTRISVVWQSLLNSCQVLMCGDFL